VSDISFTASSGSIPYQQNLDQAAVIAVALEQIFLSSAPASERRQAAVAYIRDELADARCQAAAREAAESLSPQLNLLDPLPPDGIVGLAVQPLNVCRKCGDPVAVVGAGTPPHYASLHCRSCGVFRGWLSRVHCAYLAEVIADAGVPRKPIILSHDNHGNGRDMVQPQPLVSLHQQT
jgi:hypothetical protein